MSSSSFFLQKSATSLSFLVVGIGASLLGQQLLPTNLMRIEQLGNHLPIDNQFVQASKSNLVMSASTLTAANDISNVNPSVFTSSSSTNTPTEVEKVGPVGIILGLAVVGGAIGIALNSRKTNNPFKSSSSLYHSANLSNKSKESTIHIGQASRKLQKKLLRLLHDERDTANRLLSQAKMKNPNRSIDWYVEKVIYDLERDRGKY
jgi:hypothetical protein